ncbi:CQ113 protein, partial [Nothoprocta pentlandii]|nr:CQ113 protein [Nothoprocta pentlandii]
MVPPGKKPAGETSNSNKKCKRYFNEHWKEEFTWLEFDYERKLMFCLECRQALVKNKHGKAENAFTVGTDNFQRHALLRHVTSGAHRQALAVNREHSASEARGRAELQPLLKVEVNPAKIAILTTVYWMAKEEIPLEKVSSLLELQRFNLCQALLTSEHSDYYRPGSVREMQVRMREGTRPGSCPSPCCGPWPHGCRPEALSALHHVALPGIKCQGPDLTLGTQGAFGAGSGAQLSRERHDVSLFCPKRSDQREQVAREDKITFEIRGRSHDIRYRCRLGSFLVLQPCALVEVMGKGDPASCELSCKDREGPDAVKDGPHGSFAFPGKRVECRAAPGPAGPPCHPEAVFLLSPCCRRPAVAQAAVAKVLQREARRRIAASPFVGLLVEETADAAAVFGTTVAAGDGRPRYRGVQLEQSSPAHRKRFERLKESYLESARGGLLESFPGGLLEALSSFSAIFNPRRYPRALEEVGAYGVGELDFLLRTYSRVVQSERARGDFPLFKRVVLSLGPLSFKELCAKLACGSSEMHELFPDFAVLAAVALALPLGSGLAAKLSRGRELLARGRPCCAADDGLSDLVQIAVDGPPVNEFDFALAVEYYESMREAGCLAAQVK